ncbi:MAG: efflux RND transporter permease subunit, partial [Myxococcales bacterium]|nr:efflux RND transporter permease subunit [Myxococcales bacterium]
MSIADLVVSRSRLFFSAAVLLTLVGVLSWLTMSRQEDPTIPARAALIVTPFPGASAANVERLVVDPLEDALGQVDEIKNISTSARAGVAVTVIELRDDVTDVAPVYDEVSRLLGEVAEELPDAALTPDFQRDIFDQESIVVAAIGADDPRELADAIELLEDRLLALPEVSRTIISADPGDQITIELNDAAAGRLGIDPRMLAAVLNARNGAIPGGTIVAGGRTIIVEPQAEFHSLDEIRNTPIPLADGTALPLGEIANVRRGVVEPVTERMRWNGQTAVAIGIVPRSGANLVTFGQRVEVVLDEVGAEIVHVHSLEGYPMDIVAAIRATGRPVVVTPHNYHYVCPQVDLLRHENGVCLDYDGGRACVGCLRPAPPWKARLRRRFEQSIATIFGKGVAAIVRNEILEPA